TMSAASTSRHTTDLNVDLGDRSYPIVIGSSLLSDVQLLQEKIKGKKTVIVTNTVVAPLYLATLENTLRAAGKEVVSVVLPDGEDQKN
ncbi:3-dehydroquinate synthase, partial [Acinetobacter baumannii]